MEIILDNASCKKNDYTILYDLNITIDGSKLTGITGTNKTPFIELISGIGFSSSGKVIIDNKELNEENMFKIRKEVAVIRQNADDQFFTESVKDEMEFIVNNLEYKNSDISKKIISSLHLVGLDNTYLNKKIKLLSSGEKKLIQVAVSLLCNPKIIIFDEPIVNLDYNNKRIIINLIKMLKEKYNKMVIIASNNSDLLYSLCDNLLILSENTLVVSGKTSDLFKSIDMLKKYNIDIPDLVLFVSKAKAKKIKISYQRDIRDLIKDVYKHV